MITGNWAGAVVDAAGVVADTGAAFIPGVPGGVGSAIQTSRAATNVVEAATKTAVKSPGAATAREATKTDRLKAHVLNGELDAARREAAGEVVSRKADGTPWNHVQELRDAQRGLLNRIDSINRQLGKDGLSNAQRSALQRELGEASQLLDRSEEFLPR